MSVGFFQISLPSKPLSPLSVFLELRNSGVTACRSSAHFASFPRNAIHKQQRVYYVRTHRDIATWRVTTALPEETRRGQTQTNSGGDTKTRLTSHLQFQFLPLSREETRRALKNNDAATQRQITFQKHDWKLVQLAGLAAIGDYKSKLQAWIYLRKRNIFYCYKHFEQISSPLDLKLRKIIVETI